jgi:RHS repeat-associated protein
LKRILTETGYYADGNYYFYIKNHLGSNVITADRNGNIVQNNHYYPFGLTMEMSTGQGVQPHKYTGKELDMEHGLNLYDFTARTYDPAIGRFTTVDPLAEKSYSVSPYAYCGNNPVRFIDPDGRDVKPIGEEALKMIQNTLTKKDMQYVRLDKNGLIDKEYFNSHTSESGNYQALSILVNSDILVNVSLGNSFEYMDNDGNMQTKTMSYQEADPDFADPGINDVNGVSTGEGGHMGQTLLPGKGTSGLNSPDNSIKVIVNKYLSEPAKAEMYSHEANGHAVTFIRTGDRSQAGHKFSGSMDVNKPLTNRIITSRQETIKNMKNRLR